MCLLLLASLLILVLMLTHVSAVACILPVASFPLVVDFHPVFGSLLEVISQRTFVCLSTFASNSSLAVRSIFAVGSSVV